MSSSFLEEKISVSYLYLNFCAKIDGLFGSAIIFTNRIMFFLYDNHKKDSYIVDVLLSLWSINRQKDKYGEER
jgi:hypothetical protein